MLQELLNLLVVLLITAGITCSIAVLYSLCLRLLPSCRFSKALFVQAASRIGFFACGAACIAIIVFALWMMIPVFH